MCQNTADWPCLQGISDLLPLDGHRFSAPFAAIVVIVRTESNRWASASVGTTVSIVRHAQHQILVAHPPGAAVNCIRTRTEIMSKKDLIEAVAKDCELTKEKATVAVDAMLDHIKRSMKDGSEVRIPDFGTFKVAKRKARDGRNPATGATIKIPASTVPKFTPAKGLKDLLN
jgi:DNA-binding protein HU-beta